MVINRPDFSAVFDVFQEKKGCTKDYFNEFVQLSSDLLSFDLFYILFTVSIILKLISKR